MQSVTIISSSPPRVFAASPTPVLSSSPSLPSPDSLFNPDNPRKRSKSSNTVRDGFGSGFTSAKRLLRQKSNAENVPVSNRRSQLSKGTSLGSSPPESPSQNEICAAVFRDRCKTDIRPSDSSQPTDKANNTSIPSQQNHTAKRSNEQVIPALSSQALEGINDSDSLLLERAAPRRLDWTPTKDSAPIELSPGAENASFGSVLESFSYVSKTAPKLGTLQRQHSSEAPTKRKKIELVSEDAIHLASKQTRPRLTTEEPSGSRLSEKRSKSPKKKSLTITAKATSQYFGEEQSEVTPLMQYLNSGAQGNPISTTSVSNINKKRPAARPPQGRGKKEHELIVLSPGSAAKQYENQDLLFGSASQLAREESPTLLKNTIQAMKESETSFSSTNLSNTDTAAVSISSEERRSLSFIGSRNLWAVANRDEGNNLLQVETIDLTIPPAARQGMCKPGDQEDQNIRPITRREPAPVTNTEDGWLDIDAVRPHDPYSPLTAASTLPSSVTGSRINFPRPNSAGRPISPKRAIHTNTVPGPDVNSESTKNQPAMDKPHSEPSNLNNSIVRSATASHLAPFDTQKPSFTDMTTAELSSQLKSYDFKPVKKRDKMIELLERCWKDKQTATTTATINPESASEPANQPVNNTHDDILSNVYDLSSRPVPKIPKARGRPKKDTASSSTASPEKKKNAASAKKSNPSSSTSRTSEQETSRPPSASNANQPPSTPPTLPPPVPAEDLASDPTISMQITRAILAQPPTGDRDNPTFHEKMLLYDPIPLEDLTAWLNTEGFRAVGEDREAGVWEVRSWCEVRGVTCLGVGVGSWRAARRGR